MTQIWFDLILEHTERSQTLVTFETFDQRDDKTWSDWQNDNDKDKSKGKINGNDDDKYI